MDPYRAVTRRAGPTGPSLLRRFWCALRCTYGMHGHCWHMNGELRGCYDGDGRSLIEVECCRCYAVRVEPFDNHVWDGYPLVVCPVKEHREEDGPD